MQKEKMDGLIFHSVSALVSANNDGVFFLCVSGHFPNIDTI